MAPALLDEVSIDDNTSSQPNKRRRFNQNNNKSRRKIKNPRGLTSYLSTNTPGQSSEIKTNKNKGKEIDLNADSDVREMNKNTPQRMVFKDAVPENLREDQINERQEIVNISESSNGGFELDQCVRIMRQLECSGYVESSFRQKFLTWFGLRATVREKSIVKTFIHVFKDDAKALAEQLVDTFSDCIQTKSCVIGDGDRGGCSSVSFKKPRY